MTNKSEWDISRPDADSSAWADAGFGDGDLTPDASERPRLSADEEWFQNLPARLLSGRVTQDEFDRYHAMRAWQGSVTREPR